MNEETPIRQQCPSLTEFFDPAADHAAHVAGCSRCQALLALGKPVPNEAVEQPREFPRAELPNREPLTSHAVGELLAISHPENDGEDLVAVVLAWSDAEAWVQVAPVSTERWAATEWDLLLDAEAASLGYDVIVETWNHGRVDASRIRDRLGRLDDSASEALFALYEAVFERDAPPNDVPVGPPLLDAEDPRALRQDDEAERARTYWQDPLEGATEADTLGVWVWKWFESSGCDAGDLARDAGWMRSEVDLVLSDSIDPAVSPFLHLDRVADLLAQTDIEEDQLEHLLPASVPAGRFPEPEAPPREAVFHRGAGARRRSARSVDEPDAEPTEGQRRAQAEWVNGVIAAFEEAKK